MLSALIHEPGEPAEHLVVWMHGLGASGEDFVALPRLFGTRAVRWVFPHAPVQPVTLNGGHRMPSWYDIQSLEPGPDRESWSDLQESAAAVKAIVERYDVPSERTVLAGFSQGGAVALHLGLRYPETLAGIVALSTYLVRPEALATEAHAANAATPIFFGHGREDDVVAMARGKAAHDALSEGRDVVWHPFSGGHSVVPDELRALRRWLSERDI